MNSLETGRWASESIGHFLENTEGSRVQWIVERLVPRGELVLLLGAPKQGKTLIAEAIAMSVACGQPFAEKFSVRQGPVLLILEEDRREEVRGRLESLAVGLGLDLRELPIRLLIRKQWRLDQPAGLEWLTQEIKSHGIVLAIVDCLSGVHQLRENERDDMGPLLRPLLPLLEDLGCALLFTHHVSKPSQNGSKGNSSSIHSARGSGEVSAIARSILHVTRTGNRWSVKAMGNYDPPKPFKLELEKTDLMQSVLFVDEEEEVGGEESDETCAAILARETAGLTTEEVRKRRAKRAAVVKRELEDLEMAGQAERRLVTRKGESGDHKVTAWFARIIQ